MSASITDTFMDKQEEEKKKSWIATIKSVSKRQTLSIVFLEDPGFPNHVFGVILKLFARVAGKVDGSLSDQHVGTECNL